MTRLSIFLLWIAAACAETVTQTPFAGITYIRRNETSPRNLTMHIVLVDLTAPGIRFKLTPPGGSRETVRQTTLDFLSRERAQVAINAHFFLPYPSEDADAFVIGLAASEGRVYSDFEEPTQSYALVRNAPALNIDRENHVSIVHPGDPRTALWNAVAGSAQIVTDGAKTLPEYLPTGTLTPGGPQSYSNADSWYQRINARTAIGITRDGRTLVLFIVDRATVAEVADILRSDYGVWNALNLDGGGSTGMVLGGVLLNSPAEGTSSRAVGSNLAVFANPSR